MKKLRPIDIVWFRFATITMFTAISIGLGLFFPYSMAQLLLDAFIFASAIGYFMYEKKELDP